MKLLGVKFYQGVKIGSVTETYAQPVNYTIKEVDKGVTISKGGKTTLTSWNNVQYIEYDDAPTNPIMEQVKKNK
jgi:hypothetical protein